MKSARIGRRSKRLLEVSVAVILAASVHQPAWAQNASSSESEGESPSIFPVAGGALLGGGLVAGTGVLLCAAEPEDPSAFIDICAGALVVLFGTPIGAGFGARWALDRSGFRSSGGRALLAGVLFGAVGGTVGYYLTDALKPTPVWTCVDSGIGSTVCSSPGVSDTHKIVGWSVGMSVFAFGTAYLVRSGAVSNQDSSRRSVSVNVVPQRRGGAVLMRIRF